MLLYEASAWGSARGENQASRSFSEGEGGQAGQRQGGDSRAFAGRGASERVAQEAPPSFFLPSLALLNHPQPGQRVRIPLLTASCVLPQLLAFTNATVLTSSRSIPVNEKHTTVQGTRRLINARSQWPPHFTSVQLGDRTEIGGGGLSHTSSHIESRIKHCTHIVRTHCTFRAHGGRRCRLRALYTWVVSDPIPGFQPPTHRAMRTPLVKGSKRPGDFHPSLDKPLAFAVLGRVAFGWLARALDWESASGSSRAADDNKK